MASTIAAVTTGGGGVITTADSSGNLSLLSGATTVVAVTSTGASVTGTLAVSGVTTLTGGFTVGATAAPAFSAYQSSAQTISSSTFTKISFQSELFDTANAFDSTTNYRFTPLIAGYYQVTGAYYFASITSVQAYIYKNGVSYQVSPYTSQNGQFISGLVYLNGSTDYVEMYAYLLGGGALTAAKEQTYFQAAMVRSA